MSSATTNNDPDFEEHRKTFALFAEMVKWSIIGGAVTLVALFLLIQP